MKALGFIYITIIILLTACNGNESTKKAVIKEIKKETKMLKAEEVKLKLGMTFEEIEAIPKMQKKHTDAKQWGYLNIYKKQWSTKKPVKVILTYDDNKTLELPNTIKFYSSANSNRVKKGLYEFETQTGITQADLLPYEEARVMFHSFLQRLLKEGWKRALSPYDPRITGRHAMHYKLTEDKRYYQDPEYEPTLEEWKKLEKGGFTSPNYWVLHYKNKIFLEIKLGVVPNKTDATLASYLMFITIRDGEEEAMRYFDGDEKPKWKSLWHEVKEEAMTERQKTETKLKTKGYTMDESYEDYVIDPKQW